MAQDSDLILEFEKRRDGEHRAELKRGGAAIASGELRGGRELLDLALRMAEILRRTPESDDAIQGRPVTHKSLGNVLSELLPENVAAELNRLSTTGRGVVAGVRVPAASELDLLPWETFGSVEEPPFWSKDATPLVHLPPDDYTCRPPVSGPLRLAVIIGEVDAKDDAEHVIDYLLELTRTHREEGRLKINIAADKAVFRDLSNKDGIGVSREELLPATHAEAATRNAKRVEFLLRHRDVVHYFGHSDFKGEPAESLRLAGTTLDVERLLQMLDRDAPRLLVITACAMSPAFARTLLAGANGGEAPEHVVTMTTIVPSSATAGFCREFYDRILNRDDTVDHAVAKARRSFEEESKKPWLCWVPAHWSQQLRAPKIWDPQPAPRRLPLVAALLLAVVATTILAWRGLDPPAERAALVVHHPAHVAVELHRADGSLVAPTTMADDRLDFDALSIGADYRLRVSGDGLIDETVSIRPSKSQERRTVQIVDFKRDTPDDPDEIRVARSIIDVRVIGPAGLGFCYRKSSEDGPKLGAAIDANTTLQLERVPHDFWACPAGVEEATPTVWDPGKDGGKVIRLTGAVATLEIRSRLDGWKTKVDGLSPFDPGTRRFVTPGTYDITFSPTDAHTPWVTTRRRTQYQTVTTRIIPTRGDVHVSHELKSREQVVIDVEWRPWPTSIGVRHGATRTAGSPGVQVFVDDRPVGWLGKGTSTTLPTKEPLAPGLHKVRFERRGHSADGRSFVVRVQDEEAWLTEPAWRLRRLEVDTTRIDPEITVKVAVRIGRSPPRFEVVPSGPGSPPYYREAVDAAARDLEFWFVRDGYEMGIETVRVSPGEPVTLVAPIMRKLTAPLQLAGDIPIDVRPYLVAGDVRTPLFGLRHGQVELNVMDADIGTQKIEFQRFGYRSQIVLHEHAIDGSPVPIPAGNWQLDDEQWGRFPIAVRDAVRIVQPSPRAHLREAPASVMPPVLDPPGIIEHVATGVRFVWVPGKVGGVAGFYIAQTELPLSAWSELASSPTSPTRKNPSRLPFRLPAGWTMDRTLSSRGALLRPTIARLFPERPGLADLPTLEEWTWAASGPAGHPFPWGAGDGQCINKQTRASPSPVAVDHREFRGPSWCDAWHMAGNVHELTKTRRGSGRYVAIGGSYAVPIGSCRVDGSNTGGRDEKDSWKNTGIRPVIHLWASR